MPNYKKLYLSLFNDVTDIIEQLQMVQRKAEELYMQSPKMSSSTLSPAPAGEKKALE